MGGASFGLNLRPARRYKGAAEGAMRRDGGRAAAVKRRPDVRVGAFIVTRVCVALLAAGLLGLVLCACSRTPKAPDVGFLPTRAVAQATEDSRAAFEAAKVVCLEEARRKGISSVTRLLLLRGKISESDYVECMEQKGFAAVDE